MNELSELFIELNEEWYDIFQRHTLIEHSAVMTEDRSILLEAQEDLRKELQNWGDKFFRQATTILMRSWEQVIDETEKDKTWYDANAAALKAFELGPDRQFMVKNYKNIIDGKGQQVVDRLFNSAREFSNSSRRTVHTHDGSGQIMTRLKAEYAESLGIQIDDPIGFMKLVKEGVMGPVVEKEMNQVILQSVVREIPGLLKTGIQIKNLSQILTQIRNSFQTGVRILGNEANGRFLADALRSQAQVLMTVLGLTTGIYNQVRSQYISILKKAIGGGVDPEKKDQKPGEPQSKQQAVREDFTFLRK